MTAIRRQTRMQRSLIPSAAQEVVDRRLQVVDLTSTIMCMENKMPMIVFGLNEENSIVKTLSGEFSGTYVTVD